ncbi:sialate O-acetylesterase [Persicirhabdus sediminis]|uniref:Sialate O-acetylesterase domain-containing protein n=1 Tax=Persicirhabdus sediminis TaxID=454144 RepID=A0A8J7SPE6_9BACT|nr:sialate O-acetylesterase [Persicirhabdus sediminis]MBK1792288.1 hypothetical protein [Persicirhabdus sediminis]
MKMKKTLLIISYLSSLGSLFADVKLAPIFADHMVLQRDMPVPIWGTADADEKVEVSFAGQTLATQADAEGNWKVKFEPLESSKVGADLRVAGSNTITLKNVVVGEVWLCSGQSNMAGRFNEQKGRRMDPAVFESDVSGLRFLTRQGWRELNERSQSQISAVAFYFAYELYQQLDVPVGLLQRYNSATPIQAWMPKEKAEEIRQELGIPAGWNDVHEIRNPGVQFEDKIADIIPVAMRGVIWYQGERNAKAKTGWEYDRLLAFHIKTWRDLWAVKAGGAKRDFPFYYVQVPTQETPVDAEWPWLRDRMRRALDLSPNTGMAVFYDYGPSLHPDNKEPAGQRLALWALANDYGKDIVYSGPLLDEVKYADGKAILSFKHVGGGLKNKSGEKQLKFFEIAGPDGNYQPALAEIVGDTVVVSNESITEPANVRYLFRKPSPDAELSLINAAGLPASSFMTDDNKPAR